MPHFAIVDALPKRFEGEFAIKVNAPHSPNDAERNYIAALGRVMTSLAKDDAASNAGRPALVLAKKRQREETVAELRSQADEFVRGAPAAEFAADKAFVIMGKYVQECEHLSRQLFVVEEYVDPTTRLVTGFDIEIAPGLPPPNDTPTLEQQALFVEIYSALTTILTVCQRMQPRGKGWLRGKSTAPPAQIGPTHAQRTLDRFARKLAAIARLGLQDPHIQLAKLALEELKNEFVAQESGRIKNAYIQSLGGASAVAALLFLGVYALVETAIIKGPFWQAHKAFLLAATGAAIGAWLSFSIRRVALSFKDLAILEEDLLDPGVRILFVICLTITACLFFWIGAINIEIGGLKTSKFAGSTALLVGLLFGIAERALATAISGRAVAFVKGGTGGV